MASMNVFFNDKQLREIVDSAIAERFPALDAAAKVIKAAEVWRDRVSGLILGSHELPLADAVDEFRATT